LIFISPEVKAIRVAIYILGFWRVKLHHGVFFLPKEAFDKAHLFPIRASVLKGYRHMLPSVLVPIVSHHHKCG
jgi:hypothetical protein